jgi:galactonate dehydratase
VLPEHLHLVGGLVGAIPLATGERLYSRWDFHAQLAAGIAVAQPDPSHAGGISEVRRIAALAEVHGASLAPHCPLGPIALAAALQLGFAVPNFLIQEQSLRMHYHQAGDLLDYLVDPSVFDFVDGHATRPARTRPRHRDRRAGGAPSGGDRPLLAQPGVAPRRRQPRRVVSPRARAARYLR